MERAMPSFEELLPETGFLTDRQIQLALDASFLIEKGTWVPEQVRHASYTIRLGSEVRFTRTRNTPNTSSKEINVRHLSAAEPKLDIQPGDTVLLYSMERLDLPDSILAFTVARGVLFAEALSPENTYVDPGYRNPIYTTVTNVSERTVQLEYGMPIARLFFYRLSELVKVPYRAGDALGITQQLNSVHVAPNRTAVECRQATDLQLLETIKLIPLGGMHAVETVERLKERIRIGHLRLGAFSVIWPPLLVLATSKWVADNMGNMGTFLGGVASSVVAAGLCFLFAKAWSHLRPRSPA
jgi:deoxycytidine triphosphate deaminase